MKLTEFLKSNAYDYLVIVRNAFILMFPMYLISSIILFAAAMCELMDIFTFSALLKDMHRSLTHILPALLTVSVAYFYVMKFKLPTIHIAVSIGIFFQIGLVIMGDSGLMVSYFLACVLPFVIVPIIDYFYKKSWSKLVKDNHMSKIMAESFKLVIPIMILTTLFIIGYFFLSYLLSFFSFSISFPSWLKSAEFGQYFYALGNSLFWWIGFHGGMLLEGFPAQIAQSSGVSITDITNTLNAFVFIGGSGATLSLIIAILVASKRKKDRTIAMSALPFSIFNINEIILYGLPLIFNLRLLLPFILVPIINVFIINFAINSHIITISGHELSFSTLIFLNAWIGTNEGLIGLLLQIFMVVVGFMVYIPFVTHKEEQDKIISFAAFNAQFTDQAQEVIFKVDDPIKNRALLEHENQELVDNLERISKYEYMLHYQPQVSSETGLVTGCEALIRARDMENKLIPPFSFLPWFHKAGMNKDVDLWVLEEAYKQAHIFKSLGLHIPISVNITAKTIQNRKFIDYALDLIRKSDKMINIELTEDMLAGEDIMEVLGEFKQAGSNNYVDDFGTGYSSLSYLYKLPVDAIKIDRSFVVALEYEKGRKLFEGLLLLGQKMGYKMVVEGVETQKQLDYLRGYGNEFFIQGWYYSKALCEADFINFAIKNS